VDAVLEASSVGREEAVALNAVRVARYVVLDKPCTSLEECLAGCTIKVFLLWVHLEILLGALKDVASDA
jgi:hypothetical protein